MTDPHGVGTTTVELASHPIALSHLLFNGDLYLLLPFGGGIGNGDGGRSGAECRGAEGH